MTPVTPKEKRNQSSYKFVVRFIATKRWI